MADFKRKRIEYINNWPNSEKFDVEKKYENKIAECFEKSSFEPMQMELLVDENYNKAVSFIIDAIEAIDSRPQHSFGYIFTAFDLYSKSATGINRITDRIWFVIDRMIVPVVLSNPMLDNAFKLYFNKIPQKTLQYLFLNLYDCRIRERVKKNISGVVDVNRENLLNHIITKYSNDFSKYETDIRPGSRLIYHILNTDNINIDSVMYNIDSKDRWSFLLSGYIYSLRNDNEHGSTISVTKSSLTKMNSFANSYFAFLMVYYILLIIIIEQTASDKNAAYIEMEKNMQKNLNHYTKLFGHALIE